MMKIYHGSTMVVRHPEIRPSNRTLDYGQGFYATSSQIQAESWIRRRSDEEKNLKGYLNVYSFDDSQLDQLNVLSFEDANEHWVDFVMKNRTELGFTHAYDIVYGPVANDKVYASFALFESGLIDKTTLISELKTYKLVDQFLFHTEKSLLSLTFLEAIEIR